MEKPCICRGCVKYDHDHEYDHEWGITSITTEDCKGKNYKKCIADIPKINNKIKVSWLRGFNDYYGSSDGLYITSDKIGYPVLQNRQIATISRFEDYRLSLFGFQFYKTTVYPRNYEQAIMEKISEFGLYLVTDNLEFMMTNIALCIGKPESGEYPGEWKYGEIFKPIEMIPYLMNLNSIQKHPGWNYQRVEIEIIRSS